MDAMNRVLGYHTYPPQQPSAVSIAVKSKEQVDYYSNNNKCTDMSGYMLTRKIDLFGDMKFTTLYKKFYYSSIKPGVNKIES